MSADLRTVFDTVADDPSPDFLANLERRLTAELTDLADRDDLAAPSGNGSVGADDAMDEVDVIVPLAPVVSIDRHRPRRRTAIVAAGWLAAAAALVAVVTISRRPDPTGPAAETLPSVSTSVAAVTTAPIPSTAPPSTSAVVPSTVEPTPTTPTTTQPSTAPESTVTEPVAPGWNDLPAPGLSPRRDPLVVSVGGRVLVFGGTDDTFANIGPIGPNLSDGVVYDAASSTWTPMTPAPFTPVGAVAEDGGVVYVVGKSGQAATYDVATDRWSDLPSGQWSSRYLPVMGLWNGRLYVMGGYTTICADCGGLDDGAQFDVASGTWEPLALAPSRIEPGRAAFVIDALVAADEIFGGDGSSWGKPDLHVYRMWSGETFALTLPGDATTVSYIGPIGGDRALVVTDAGAWTLDPRTLAFEPFVGLDFRQYGVVRTWQIPGASVFDIGSAGPQARSFATMAGDLGEVVPFGAPANTNNSSGAVIDNRLLFTDGTSAVLSNPFARGVGARGDEMWPTRFEPTTWPLSPGVGSVAVDRTSGELSELNAALLAQLQADLESRSNDCEPPEFIQIDGATLRMLLGCDDSGGGVDFRVLGWERSGGFDVAYLAQRTLCIRGTDGSVCT